MGISQLEWVNQVRSVIVMIRTLKEGPKMIEPLNGIGEENRF